MLIDSNWCKASARPRSILDPMESMFRPSFQNRFIDLFPINPFPGSYTESISLGHIITLDSRIGNLSQERHLATTKFHCQFLFIHNLLSAARFPTWHPPLNVRYHSIHRMLTHPFKFCLPRSPFWGSLRGRLLTIFGRNLRFTDINFFVFTKDLLCVSPAPVRRMWITHEPGQRHQYLLEIIPEFVDLLFGHRFDPTLRVHCASI